jgi:arylsulfatase A-like enzyme
VAAVFAKPEGEQAMQTTNGWGRRDFLRLAGLGAVGAALLPRMGKTAESVVPGAESARPNILFILADDLGWRDVGCFGSTFYETPNIDRLARRGVRFTQAYAANPLCSPTRASIQTGFYPARIGITSPACHVPQVQLEKKLATGNPRFKVLNADSLTRLKPEYFTLAEALHEAGYATAHFGKWHLGHNLPQNPGDHYEPKDQGFDSDFPHTPAAAGPGGGYLAPWKFIKDPPLEAKPGEHIEDRMSAEAAKYILAHKDRPFYVNYCAYSVHSPWNARHDYIEHFKAKADEKDPQHNPLYAAMVKSLDDGVGRLLAAVDEAGIADRTIIVFFSDNGGYSYPPKVTDPEGFENMPATSNLPLRSGKASLYEGGTREPCIFIWPRQIKPDTTNEALFQSVDFYPTLLAMCGLKPHGDLKLDGLDQTATLLGRPAVRDRVFCHFPHGSTNQAAQIPGMLPGTYVRRGDWKLIRFFADNDDGSDRFELFNLKDDLGETKNLAADKPDLVRELNALIAGFLSDTEAVIPVRNPNYVPPDQLQGWKARNCDAVVKDGALVATGKGAAAFLGVGADKAAGAAVVRFRARCAQGGAGKIEWVAPGKAAPPQSAPCTWAGGDWQEVRVEVPAKGPLGILRIYLPAQPQPVEIQWIELQARNQTKRWDFGGH